MHEVGLVLNGNTKTLSKSGLKLMRLFRKRVTKGVLWPKKELLKM